MSIKIELHYCMSCGYMSNNNFSVCPACNDGETKVYKHKCNKNCEKICEKAYGDDI